MCDGTGLYVQSMEKFKEKN
jgi:ribosomal protein L39E